MPDDPLAALPRWARSVANPPPPGPGLAPGNVERTGAQRDPGSVGGGTLERPERYLLVAALQHEPASVAPGTPDAEPRYLLAHWPDWPHPTLLSLVPPAAGETIEDAVASLLHARMGVAVAAPPRLAPARTPARMRHPGTGIDGLGWLRAVAVAVTGEPSPDALLDAVEVLSYAEALAALPTEVERIVFRSGVDAAD